MPNDDKPAPPPNRPAQPARREPVEDKPTPAAPRATRIVEETGRYVCKRGITFTDDKGRRQSARKGDVVSIGLEDAQHLKRVGAVVEETREE